MSFKFHCSNCGHNLEAEEHHIGSNMNCPSCSQTLEIPKPNNTEDSIPPPLEAVKWHYELDGQAFGPVSENEIQRLVVAGKVTTFTRVWTKGMSGWVNAGDSALKGLFAPTGSYTPATDQIKAAAETLQKEWTKLTRDLVRKSSPFLKAHVIPRLKTPRYIVFLSSLLIYFYEGYRMTDLQRQAAPIIAQLNERHSLTHQAKQICQSFLSVVLDENITAIRNGFDVWFGDDPLKKRLAPILRDLTDASSWQQIAMYIALISLGWIILKHYRDKRGTIKPLGTI